MPVCRLIFRFDFKANFKIIDQIGEAMRLLTEDAEFLPDLREARQERRVFATYKSEEQGLFRILSVAPNSIFGVLETVTGVDIGRIEGNEHFTKLIRLTNSICKKFDIKIIKRSGLRLIYLSRLTGEFSKTRSAFDKLVESRMISAISTSLGKPEDAGFAYDGESEDEIKYHLRVGPYRKDEAGKYVQEFVEKLKQSGEFDFVMDLDLYQHDFSLSDAVLIKWYVPKLTRAESFVKSIEQIVREAEKEN